MQFSLLKAGKRSLCVDLKKPAGRAVSMSLRKPLTS